MTKNTLICTLKFLGFIKQTGRLLPAEIMYKKGIFVYIYNPNTIRISDNQVLTAYTSYESALKYITQNDQKRINL